MKDYQRINFNIKTTILDEVSKYSGDSGVGRSALLNYLVASALANKAVVKMLEDRLEIKKG